MPALALLVAAAVVRLSADVMPSRYVLRLDVTDLAAPGYSGGETIDVTLARPAEAIVLHGRELTVTKAAARVGAREVAATVTADADAQTLTLRFAAPLPAGKATLSLDWTSPWDAHLRGLYRVKHGGDWFLGTQLEAIDARRMFPCFDEPALKATFELTVTAPRGLEVLTNTRPVETRTAGKSQLVHFAATPPISTYLVALAVGPYASIHERIKVKKGELDVAVWAPKGQEQLGRTALAVASDVVPWFERYFDQPYPFDKLDLIDVPDFEFGAMENAGAITFADSALLVDDKRATPREVRTVAVDVAHEIAHQWFGDLVTMRWWDDLWLNESFATWMEMKSLEAVRPQLHAMDAFQAGRAAALGEDALGSTHPIHTPLTDAADFETQVDAITYEKGASVLVMLEAYLGADAMRAGIRRHLAAHRYGNATADDLWAALDTPEKPVKKLAHSWVDQPGFPLVEATLACDKVGASLAVRQRRFFADPDALKSAAPATWQVPLCLRQPSGESCTLVEAAEAKLPLASCPAWLDANAHRAGFYRVRYDDAALAALTKAYHELDGVERAALLDDEDALVEAGLSTVERQLPLVEQAAGEQAPLPLDAAIAPLEFWSEHVVLPADRPAFARAVERIVGPTAKALGWRARPGDTDELRRARLSALVAVGSLARPEALVKEARERLARLFTEPGALEPVEADAALAISATNGDAPLWDKLLAAAQTAKTPQERERYLGALPRFEAPQLVQKTLDLALGGTLRLQESGWLVLGELHSRHGGALAWAAVQKRWPDVVKQTPTFTRVALTSELGGVCRAPAQSELAAFFARPDVAAPELERAKRTALESNRTCAALVERSAPAVHAWLTRR